MNSIPIRSADCGSHHSAFIDFSGELYTCGANHTGQLGIGSREPQSVPTLVKTEKVAQVACGVFHTLILLGNIC